MPEILTGQQAAERIGWAYPALMEAARGGLIPCIRSGRRVLFNLDQVLNALNEIAVSEARASSLATCA